MKTFKLCALSNREDTAALPLIEGLIINKEDKDKKWLIEGLFEESHLPYFQEWLEENKTIPLSAIITTTKNKPVDFEGQIQSVKTIESNAHVLVNASRVEDE